MKTYEELLEAVRSMQKSVNDLEAVIVEQIGNREVVTAKMKDDKTAVVDYYEYVYDGKSLLFENGKIYPKNYCPKQYGWNVEFWVQENTKCWKPSTKEAYYLQQTQPELTELPKLWYVDLYEKSIEFFVRAVNNRAWYDGYDFIGNTVSDQIVLLSKNYALLDQYTKLTYEQFERLKYNHWKESLKPKQFDPETADRKEFYRALCGELNAVVFYSKKLSVWLVRDTAGANSNLKRCTHIDPKPIGHSDIPEYKHKY